MKFNLKNLLFVIGGTIAFLLLFVWLIDIFLPIIILIAVFPSWLGAVLGGK